MEKESSALNNFSFIEILAELLRWRKFVFIQVSILIIFSVVLALSLPKTFSSSSTILPPGQTNLLNSILPQSLTRGLAGALGGGAFDQDGETTKVLAILESRTLNETILSEFDLIERFESPTIEDALDSVRDIITITSGDNGIINISVSMKTDFFHPDENEEEIKLLVQEINAFILQELDDSYTKLGTQKARYELTEIERRYNQNIDDIATLETKIRDFSKETGILALPEQLEALIEASANLESQIIIESLKLSLLEFSNTESNPQIEVQKNYIKELKKQQNELRVSGSNGPDVGVLPSFDQAPDYSLEYIRLKREFEVQVLLYEFLTQQYEQLKLKEAKDTPSLQFIDLPKVPTKRSAPSRSILVIAIVGLGSFLIILSVMVFSVYREPFKRSLDKLKSLQ